MTANKLIIQTRLKDAINIVYAAWTESDIMSSKWQSETHKQTLIEMENLSDLILKVYDELGKDYGGDK